MDREPRGPWLHVSGVIEYGQIYILILRYNNKCTVTTIYNCAMLNKPMILNIQQGYLGREIDALRKLDHMGISFQYVVRCVDASTTTPPCPVPTHDVTGDSRPERSLW